MCLENSSDNHPTDPSRSFRMASCKKLNTSTIIHKITVRNRKKDGPAIHELNLASTASGSPTSPRRIRILDNRSTIYSNESNTSGSYHSDTSTTETIQEIHSVRASGRLVRVVDIVTSNLWNRDGECADYPEALSLARRTAHWYVDEYVSSLEFNDISESDELAIAMAAVFITFKAADFIPGLGRVKMQQLIQAYERASQIIFSGKEAARLVDQVCKSEMDIMRITRFNFSPIK